MTEASTYEVGDRVRILLQAKYWQRPGGHEGTIVRVDRYSTHRSFHWVELDVPTQDRHGGTVSMISVFNPKHMVRI